MSELSKAAIINKEFLEANASRIWMPMSHDGYSATATWSDKRVLLTDFISDILDAVSHRDINIDGGAPDSVYLPIQTISGGGP